MHVTLGHLEAVAGNNGIGGEGTASPLIDVNFHSMALKINMALLLGIYLLAIGAMAQSGQVVFN